MSELNDKLTVRYINPNNLMTGQEWYDRFENEVSNLMSSDPTEVAYEMDKAAKRAAGISE